MGALSEALDSCDPAVLELYRQHQAAELRQALNQYGASPAFTQFAAVLGSSQAQVLTEYLQQSLMHWHQHLDSLAIHVQRKHLSLHLTFDVPHLQDLDIV